MIVRWDMIIIPASFIKPVLEVLVSSVTFIINNLIKINQFPDIRKLTRISPIPKTHLLLELRDYQTVSILPILSKFCEKVVLEQITNFIKRKLIYHHYQSGYRQNHLTATMLAKLRDDIKKTMKVDEITLKVFTDYSKAFDTNEFPFFIEKMHLLNFSKRYWIFSYLTDRRNFVQFFSNISNILYTNFGVSQGYILGPAPFDLCTADMKNILDGSECIQYADDSIDRGVVCILDTFTSI